MYYWNALLMSGGSLADGKALAYLVAKTTELASAALALFAGASAADSNESNCVGALLRGGSGQSKSGDSSRSIVCRKGFSYLKVTFWELSSAHNTKHHDQTTHDDMHTNTHTHTHTHTPNPRKFKNKMQHATLFI